VFRQQVEVHVVDTDRYGRTVGHVFVGERDINREMVRGPTMRVIRNPGTVSLARDLKRWES